MWRGAVGVTMSQPQDMLYPDDDISQDQVTQCAISNDRMSCNPGRVTDARLMFFRCKYKPYFEAELTSYTRCWQCWRTEHSAGPGLMASPSPLNEPRVSATATTDEGQPSASAESTMLSQQHHETGATRGDAGLPTALYSEKIDGDGGSEATSVPEAMLALFTSTWSQEHNALINSSRAVDDSTLLRKLTRGLS